MFTTLLGIVGAIIAAIVGESWWVGGLIGGVLGVPIGFVLARIKAKQRAEQVAPASIGDPVIEGLNHLRAASLDVSQWVERYLPHLEEILDQFDVGSPQVAGYGPGPASLGSERHHFQLRYHLTLHLGRDDTRSPVLYLAHIMRHLWEARYYDAARICRLKLFELTNSDPQELLRREDAAELILTLFELGVACEAVKDIDIARKVYGRLVKVLDRESDGHAEAQKCLERVRSSRH